VEIFSTPTSPQSFSLITAAQRLADAARIDAVKAHSGMNTLGAMRDAIEPVEAGRLVMDAGARPPT